jgi:hypothetical protein
LLERLYGVVQFGWLQHRVLVCKTPHSLVGHFVQMKCPGFEGAWLILYSNQPSPSSASMRLVIWQMVAPKMRSSLRSRPSRSWRTVGS